MKSFIETFYGDKESYIRAKIERRVEDLRREVELSLKEKEALMRQLGPTLETYKMTHEPFTAWKLGKAVYGIGYCPYRPEARVIEPAKIGAFLHELAQTGCIIRIEGLNNPHCPLMYQFV